MGVCMRESESCGQLLGECAVLDLAEHHVGVDSEDAQDLMPRKTKTSCRQQGCPQHELPIRLLSRYSGAERDWS
jgi:hypothetical protein